MKLAAMVAAVVVGGLLVGACDQDAPKEQVKAGLETSKKENAEPPIPDRLAPYVEADAVWTPQENYALWWYDEEHLLFEAKDMTKAEGIALTEVPRALYLWKVGKDKPVKVSNNLWDGGYCANEGFIKIGIGYYDLKNNRVKPTDKVEKREFVLAGKWPNLKRIAWNYSLVGPGGDSTWRSSLPTVDCAPWPVDKTNEGYSWTPLRRGHGVLLRDKYTDPYKNERGWTYYRNKKADFRAKIVNGDFEVELPFKPRGRITYFEFNDGYFVYPKYGGDDGLDADNSMTACTPMHWFWADGKVKELCVDTKGIYTTNFYPARDGVLLNVWAFKGAHTGLNGLLHWNAETGEVVRVLKGLAHPASIKISPDGCHVATVFKEKFSDYKNTIRVINVCRLGEG